MIAENRSGLESTIRLKAKESMPWSRPILLGESSRYCVRRLDCAQPCRHEKAIQTYNSEVVMVDLEKYWN